MRINRAGLRLIIAVIVAVVTATAVIAYRAGKYHTDAEMVSVMQNYQKCNKRLTAQLIDEKARVDGLTANIRERDDLLAWTARELAKRGVK